MATCILRLQWALRRFAVPSNLVYFLKSLYGLGEAIKKGNYSEQDARHWREQKDALSEAIWSISNFEDVLSFS